MILTIISLRHVALAAPPNWLFSFSTTKRTPSGGSLCSALISFATLDSILGAKFSLQPVGPAEVALLPVLRLELLRWYEIWRVPEDIIFTKF